MAQCDEIPEEIKRFVIQTELNSSCLIVDPFDKGTLIEEYIEFIEELLANLMD